MWGGQGYGQAWSWGTLCTSGLLPPACSASCRLLLKEDTDSESGLVFMVKKINYIRDEKVEVLLCICLLWVYLMKILKHVLIWISLLLCIDKRNSIDTGSKLHWLLCQNSNFCLISDHAVRPWAKMTSQSSFDPSLHLAKHSSSPHFCRHLPAIWTALSGWACHNSISATITKRWMWFITWISFSPLQEDTRSMYTLMNYTVRTKLKGIFFGNY